MSQFFLFFYFYVGLYLYIYPPDSQESDRGAIHRVSNYLDLLPEIPRYCSPLEIFNRDMTVCQDHQAGKSAVKCLSQGHNRMARVGLNRDRVDHDPDALTTRPRCGHCFRILYSSVVHR